MKGNSSDAAKKKSGTDHGGPSDSAYPAPNERTEESKRGNRNRPRKFLSRSSRCGYWLRISRSFPKQTSTEADAHEDDTGNAGEGWDKCGERSRKNDRDSCDEGGTPKQEQRYEFEDAFHATSNDRVEGRDAALSRRVPSHDGLEG